MVVAQTVLMQQHWLVMDEQMKGQEEGEGEGEGLMLVDPPAKDQHT